MFGSKPPHLALSYFLVFLLMFHSTVVAVAPVGPTAKAGLAWPNGDTVSMLQFEGSNKVSWYYTWISTPINFDGGIEFVPLLWGDNSSVATWDSDIKKLLQARGSAVTAVMGFNEPDHAGQANIDPGTGAELWKEHMEPLRAQGLRLGSPGTTSAPSGKQWLLDFAQQCGTDCDYDFLVVHQYGINATQFINYVTDMYNTFQRPVWVTEWACQDFSTVPQNCSATDVANYLNATQTWLDQTPWVERYSWFGAMVNTRNVNPLNGLLDQNGALNALGLQYINWTGPGLPDPTLPKGATANGPPPKSGSNSAQAVLTISLGALSLAIMGVLASL